MSSPFQQKEVPKTTQTELNNRANFKDYLNRAIRANVPYRITSMCKECEDKNVITLSSILTAEQALDTTTFEGTFNRNQLALQRKNPFTTSYDANKLGFGLTEIKVEKQGELGTTRKTTITFVTPVTGDYFEKLQQCYFIPGMSVRVEWGHNMPGAILRDITDIEANKQIKDNIASPSYEALYEGIQGRVTNFSYTLFNGRFWNCSLEIISATEQGSPIEPLCRNDDGSLGRKCEEKVKTPPGDDPLPTRRVSKLSSSLKQIAFGPNDNSEWPIVYNIIPKVPVPENISGSFAEPFWNRLNYTGDSRDPDGGENSITSFFTNTLGAGTDEYFITWSAFERILNYSCFVSENEIKEKKNYIKFFDSRGVKLTADEYIESSDPRICVIPGSTYAKKLLDDEGRSLTATSAIEKTSDDKTNVILSNILVNVIMLIRVLEEIQKNNNDKNSDVLYVEDYVREVLDRISNVTGNLWEFIVAVDRDRPSENGKLTLTCSEIKANPNVEKLQPFNISGAYGKSVIRDANFNMKMTSAMKNQALHSSDNNVNSNQPCLATALKSFRIPAAGGASAFTNLAVKEVERPKCEPCEAGTKPKTEEEKINGFNSSAVTDTATADLNNIFKARREKALSTRNSEKKNSACNGQPLPFELTITIDGVGGLAWGQLITTDLIPQTIRDAFDWQITTVAHTVSKDGWITQIHTIPRYKTLT